MAIYFYDETGTFHVEHKLLLKRWIKSVCTDFARHAGDINIVLVTDERLLEMNQAVLQHDAYTDIITFNFNQEETVSGDLYISLDRIRENAAKFAVSLNEELYRVLIHGVLHLIGFKDKTPVEQMQMREKENEALKLLQEMFHVKHE